MAALKTQCPECDAKLRLSVDGDGEHEVECPKCGHAFTAGADGEAAEPVKANKARKAEKSEKAPTEREKAKKNGKPARNGKATKRRDDDDEDEDEDDTPKKKKRKGAAAGGGNNKLILAGAVAGVLLLGAVGAIVLAMTRDKPTAQKTDTNDTAPVVNPVVVVPGPQQPGPGGPGPIRPGTGVPTPIVPGTGNGPVPGPNPGPAHGPFVNPKEPTDEELAALLPPPPKVRISGSAVPAGKLVTKTPAIPPLAPDEDPFVRAKGFRPDGPLPTPPKLPSNNLRPLLTLDAGGHTAFVGKVFFTPKGDRIITVGEDKAVRIWDPATGDTIKTVRFPAGPGKEGSLLAAAISRSGKRLAVAGEPLKGVASGRVPIHIVSPETGAPIQRIDAASATVNCLHFSNDGNRLAVGCNDGVIQVFDVATGRAIYAEKPTQAPALEIKFNPLPRTNFIATLAADRYVLLVDLATKQRREFPIKGSVPTTLAWSNDGKFLAVGSTTGVITLCTADGRVFKTLPALAHGGKPVMIYQLQFLPGDIELAVVGIGNGGWAGIVDSNDGKVRVPFTAHSNSVFAVDVSADGQRIVTSGGNQHETYVWSMDDGKVLHRLVGTGAGVWAVAWSKDGKSLAWGNSNRRETPESELLLEGTFRLDEFGVGDPPDPSKYVQTVNSDDHVKLITTSRGIVVQTTGRDPLPILLNDGERVYAATVLPKANAVAVAGVTSLVLVNPATGRETRRFVGHTGNVLCVSPSPDGKLFATGSSDQTIRVWHPNHEEPLLSIFVAGREWIAWTSQGFYACSAQGERLIAWQVNASGSKGPQVHPAERFRSSMYQPALLKYLIPAGNMPLAIAMAQKFDKALALTTSVADVLPPEVTLDGLGDGEVTVDKPTLTVKASAKGAKHPIVAMRLLVDGRPFQGAAGVKRFDNPQPTAEATWEVPLTPGPHTIAVIADSGVSKGMSKVAAVLRPGEIPRPNLYVLAIGVGDYAPPVSKLNFCATDAEMLGKAFQEKSKSVFNKIEVKVLTEKQATKKGILAGLDWLKSKMTPQDVGIVSFSGHGSRDPFGDFYLCPVDINPRDEDHATYLSGKLFKDRLDEMPGRLVAILDACHSGTVAEKNGLARPDALVRDLTAEDSGVIVMCASAGREFAIESKITKAGFYTLGLVEGLSGHGDVDDDGVIHINELDMYASIRVKQLSGGRQNPTLGRPASVRPFVIARTEKKPKP